MRDLHHKQQPSRRLGRYDLKRVLVGRILLATTLCVAVGATIVLSSIATDARRQNEETAKAVAGHLELQLSRTDPALGLPQRFPDWQTVVDFSLQPGQCVKFTTAGSNVFSRCVGVERGVAATPEWFSRAYEAVFLSSVDAVIPLQHRGLSRGTIEVTISRLAVAHQAWLSVSDMLRLSVVLLAIMCGLVYAVVAKALNPTAEILSGLSRLAGGDLSAQLPRYRLRELDQISAGFNHLATELRVTTAERSEFARRLIAVQEQERQHIARELHDDVAQQLTAIGGLAASIRSSLSSTAPQLEASANDLVAASGNAMRALRSTLTQLRPPEIDELGLVASLEALISERNRQSGAKFLLVTSGPLDAFGPEASAHIYRIVQEGLNNAVRHAGAKTIKVSLVNASKANGSQRDAIHLQIEDDGVGWPKRASAAEGFGLPGMRERALALDGTLSLATSDSGGAAIRVQFNMPGTAP